MIKKAHNIARKQILDYEYIYPYYRFSEEGYEVDVAVRGNEAVLGGIGVMVIPTKYVSELKVAEYNVLLLPGGAKAMEYMRQDEGILKFKADSHASSGVIASICHPGQLLISSQECDAVENAPLGVQSASRANIYFIGVCSTVGLNKLTDADEIVIQFAKLRSSVVIKGFLESRRSHA
jgi:putative intracellular protease/amidase